jgi:hypothetical protein
MGAFGEKQYGLFEAIKTGNSIHETHTIQWNVAIKE